jgi:hypothetical protein
MNWRPRRTATRPPRALAPEHLVVRTLLFDGGQESDGCRRIADGLDAQVADLPPLRRADAPDDRLAHSATS